MTYRKNILTLSILLGISAVAACKKAANSSTKGLSDVGCSKYKAQITQAENDLKSRNAPIPADMSLASASTAGGSLSLSGRDCHTEGSVAYNNCMMPKCFAYSQANPGGVFVSATACQTPQDIDNAVKAGKIKDDGKTCADLLLKTIGECNQQNTATSSITYVCVTAVNSITSKPLYKWRTRAEAQRDNLSYLDDPIKVVQAGSVEAQTLNDTECANAAAPQNAADSKKTPGGLEAEQNKADIVRFTNNLAAARSGLKTCLEAEAEAAEAKNKANGAGAGGGGSVPTSTPAAAKKCAAPDAGPYDGEGQYYPYSCLRVCQDGYYKGSDSNGSDIRCYKKPATACDPATQYVGTDGGCYPLGTNTIGTATNCPAGEVLNSLKNCVKDTYSGFSGQQVMPQD